jgi:translation initiation factor 3 subunit G
MGGQIPGGPPPEGGGGGGIGGGGGDAAPSGGAYVPPSMRAGAALAPGVIREVLYEERIQLRVNNLSPETTEDDLRNLFQPFGRLDKVFVAHDRITGESRGFAFIKYTRHSDAEAARQNLNGYPLSHMILRVEWSEPRLDAPGGPGGSAGPDRRHLSGYGKALADTRGATTF